MVDHKNTIAFWLCNVIIWAHRSSSVMECRAARLNEQVVCRITLLKDQHSLTTLQLARACMLVLSSLSMRKNEAAYLAGGELVLTLSILLNSPSLSG